MKCVLCVFMYLCCVVLCILMCDSSFESSVWWIVFGFVGLWLSWILICLDVCCSCLMRFFYLWICRWCRYLFLSCLWNWLEFSLCCSLCV